MVDGKWTIGVTRNRHINGEWVLVVNDFNPVTYKEDWKAFYADLEDWKVLSDDHMLSKFVRLFNILYDADLYVDARCTNSRCDGYETEFDEWYFEDQPELFREIWSLFIK